VSKIAPLIATAVEAASRRGVAVVHAPDSCTQSVAEHALALVFALSRQLGQLDRAVQEDHWAVRDRYRGLELAGKTLGIVGLGRIGRRTAELAQAVGMKVVTWSPHSRDDRFPALALDELLRLSDVVSLHLALTPETRGLIDAKALRLFKPSSLLVNTARGALIDELALAAAIRSGHLGGAGLDVLEQEPPPADHPLLHLVNVLITPHIAAITATAYRRMCVETCEQVLRILKGEEPDPRHVNNYAAWKQFRCG